MASELKLLGRNADEKRRFMEEIGDTFVFWPKPEDQIANIHWITEKARDLQKNIYFCSIDYAKAFDCVDHKHNGTHLLRKKKNESQINSVN